MGNSASGTNCAFWTSKKERARLGENEKSYFDRKMRPLASRFPNGPAPNNKTPGFGEPWRLGENGTFEKTVLAPRRGALFWEGVAQGGPTIIII